MVVPRGSLGSSTRYLLHDKFHVGGDGLLPLSSQALRKYGSEWRQLYREKRVHGSVLYAKVVLVHIP